MSEIATITDQASQLVADHESIIDESAKTNWNGREVNKANSSEENAKIIQLFENVKNEIEKTTEDLKNAKQILEKQEEDVKKAQKEYKKRKKEDDDAWGWNGRKTEKRLEKAEKKLGKAEYLRSTQKKVVDELESNFQALVAADRSLKKTISPERYEFLRTLHPSIDPSSRDIKDILQKDSIINELRQELESKTKELTEAQNDLIQKKAGVTNAIKKYEEKDKKYEEASRYRKASKEKKKFKNAERNLNEAVKECAKAQDKVNYLKSKVDELNVQFNFLEKEKKLRLENEENNKDHLDELKKQNRVIASSEENLKKEVERLRIENENLRTENEKPKIENNSLEEARTIESLNIPTTSNIENYSERLIEGEETKIPNMSEAT